MLWPLRRRMRAEKYLQAARALGKAFDLDPEDGELHRASVDFRSRGAFPRSYVSPQPLLILPALSVGRPVEKLKGELTSPTSDVLAAAVAHLLPPSQGDDAPDAATQAFLSRHSLSPPHILSAALTLHALSLSSSSSSPTTLAPGVESTLFTLLQLGPSTSARLAALSALRFLEEGAGPDGSPRSARVEEFRTGAKALWPEARCFDTKQETADRRRAWEEQEQARKEKGERQGEAN